MQISGEEFNKLYGGQKFYILTTEKNFCLSPRNENTYKCNVQIDEYKSDVYSKGILRQEYTVHVSENPGKPTRDYNWFWFTNRTDMVYILDPEIHEYAISISIPKNAIVNIDKQTKKMNTNKINICKRTHIWSDEFLSLAAVKNNFLNLQSVTNFTTRMCMIILERNGLALQFIKPSLQTIDIVKLAVKSDPLALEFVCHHLQTEELCRSAVNENGMSLQYVKQSMQTEDLCITAIRENHEVFKYIDPDIQTTNMCKSALVRSGILIKYVNKKLLTFELCKLAVMQNGLALGYLPHDTQRMKELCVLALNQGVEALPFLQELTPDITDAITNITLCSRVLTMEDTLVLGNISNTIDTSNINDNFIKQNENNEFKNIHMQTEDICEVAVKRNGLLLEFVNNKTENLCELAVFQNGLALEFVDVQTPLICRLAIQQNINAIFYVNDQTEEQWKFVLLKNLSFGAFISDKFKYLTKTENTWLDTYNMTKDTATSLLGSSVRGTVVTTANMIGNTVGSFLKHMT